VFLAFGRAANYLVGDRDCCLSKWPKELGHTTKVGSRLFDFEGGTEDFRMINNGTGVPAAGCNFLFRKRSQSSAVSRNRRIEGG